MVSRSIKTIRYRRQREKKTNYISRRKLLMSTHPRLVVRRSLKNIWLQVVEHHPNGDKAIASAHSRELIKLGWKGSRKNLPAAYLTGLLLAKKAKLKHVKSVIPDLGLYRIVHGSKLFAALQGVKEGALQLSIGENAVPKLDRIQGKHIPKFQNNFNEIKKKIMV